jgi:hypothetical protein
MARERVSGIPMQVLPDPPRPLLQWRDVVPEVRRRFR